jgi:hypothetical protein
LPNKQCLLFSLRNFTDLKCTKAFKRCLSTKASLSTSRMHIALFKVENFSHFVEKRERERERKISNKDINKTDQKRLKESESRTEKIHYYACLLAPRGLCQRLMSTAAICEKILSNVWQTKAFAFVCVKSKTKPFRGEKEISHQCTA